MVSEDVVKPRQCSPGRFIAPLWGAAGWMRDGGLAVGKSDAADTLAIHHRDVDDDIWTAAMADGQLWVRGELGLSNAQQARSRPARRPSHGFTVVNLSGLEFCARGGAGFACGSEHPGLRLVSQERDQ